MNVTLAANGAGAVVFGIILVLIGIFLYFLPTYIAHRRNHHQFKSILALNFFLGWTFIGWVISFVMALSATDKDLLERRGSIYPPPASSPVGWYPDPADPRQLRYWDGAKWTDQVQSPS